MVLLQTPVHVSYKYWWAVKVHMLLIKTHSKYQNKTNRKDYPGSNADLYATWLDFNNAITCNDGNTSPTTKFDSQLATPAILTAAALEL